jgi:hypothetical protein
VIGNSVNVIKTVTICLIGIIVHSNDFSANEFRLTEESFGVLKISRKKTDAFTENHGCEQIGYCNYFSSRKIKLRNIGESLERIQV